MRSVTNTKKLSQRELLFLMGGMTALAFLMLIVRIRIEQDFRYTFLVWNLFLAYVPVGMILIYRHILRNRLSRLFMLGSWLLFFPNAPYIITDYIHLRYYPTLLDFIIISTYALLGLIAGFYSLRVLQKNSKTLQRNWSIPFLFLLTSVGVYLGRFIRWNSWDIVNHPLQIVQDAAELFVHPIQNAWALGFIGGFTLLLIISYRGFKLLLSRIHE